MYNKTILGCDDMNMKFIKKHANLVVAIGVVVLLVVGLLILKNFLSPSENKAIYGNRLDGRKKVEISKDTMSKAESAIKDDAKTAKVRIAGRIIEAMVVVDDGKSLDDAKAIGPKIVDSFSDKEKKYYDFQIFISKDGDSNQFPIIGYKHHTKDSISWTKDRAES